MPSCTAGRRSPRKWWCTPTAIGPHALRPGEVPPVESPFWGGHPVKHWTKLQTSIALSSGEAELYAANRAASESLGLQQLIRDLGGDLSIELRIDAAATKGTITRVGVGKMKHVEVQHFWLQSKIRDGVLVAVKIPRVHNYADDLTHHWGGKDSESRFEKMGQVDIPSADAICWMGGWTDAYWRSV